jgi:eukaryotic-like serine/threonine-protein kinase
MSTRPNRIDEYELQQSLGQNGISEAWKAFDRQAHRYVAIKLFHAQLKSDPAFVTRFQQQAHTIVSLRHPNIVPCYDFSISQFPETESATAYLVMEYLEGGTLADYNRNASQTGKLLSIPAIVHLFISIGMAVDYAHSQHVIHGNLKPTNILLDKQNTVRIPIGEPMVTDFNTARLMGPAGGNASGSRNSSPFYVSPEQVMGAPANELSDIYSLGIMLYEMCTGTVPFLGNSAESIMMQQVNTVPASPALINPHILPALSAIIMRCIAKDPAVRFASAAALVSALVDVARQGSLNMPTPENVGQSSGLVNAVEMDMPTVISTKMSPLPAGIVSSGPVYASNAQVGGASQPYPAVEWADKSAMNRPLQANTPAYTTGDQLVGNSLAPLPPSSKKPRRRLLYIVLAGILILALIGSALGAYFTFFSKGTTTTTTAASQIVGHAYFISSGLLSPESNAGITDQLQIKMGNIPPPPSGKAYYAWLLSPRTASSSLQTTPLGPLGAGSLYFTGNNTDQLAINSRLIITEEDAATPPIYPSLEPSTWLYYAEFSEIPHAMGKLQFSLYDHIRHLLASENYIKSKGLFGGLDTWLYRNTQKILEWAGSANDQVNYPSQSSFDFMHRQLGRIMCYLDGAPYVQQDLPTVQCNEPTVGIGANIGLLTLPKKDPLPFLKHIDGHLQELSILPEASASQKTLAIQIKKGLDEVNILLQTLRTDVLKLYPMNSAQLFGNDGRTQLNIVAQLANKAFAGQVTPHGQLSDGVVQINYDVQRLATFDIRACTSSDHCAL